MRWQFTLGGKDSFVEWSEGVTRTNNLVVDAVVSGMVNKREIVLYGPIGPTMFATLDDELGAYATITEALLKVGAQFGGDGALLPEPPVDFEAVLLED